MGSSSGSPATEPFDCVDAKSYPIGQLIFALPRWPRTLFWPEQLAEWANPQRHPDHMQSILPLFLTSFCYLSAQQISMTKRVEEASKAPPQLLSFPHLLSLYLRTLGEEWLQA